jgi:hypothetical protein
MRGESRALFALASLLFSTTALAEESALGLNGVVLGEPLTRLKAEHQVVCLTLAEQHTLFALLVTDKLDCKEGQKQHMLGTDYDVDYTIDDNDQVTQITAHRWLQIPATECQQQGRVLTAAMAGVYGPDYHEKSSGKDNMTVHWSWGDQLLVMQYDILSAGCLITIHAARGVKL